VPLGLAVAEPHIHLDHVDHSVSWLLPLRAQQSNLPAAEAQLKEIASSLRPSQ
jgi:hypothetical protein